MVLGSRTTWYEKTSISWIAKGMNMRILFGKMRKIVSRYNSLQFRYNKEMHRSRKILIVCNCLLNANAKVFPLAQCGGVYTQSLSQSIAAGVGLLQLPCPETVYFGLKRWGMTREQYDTLTFRNSCRQILEPSLAQISAYADAGYELLGIVGMDGSPNCGVNKTCFGFSGGEICAPAVVDAQRKNISFGKGKGVFMEILASMLEQMGLVIPFTAIDEEDPTT